MLLKSAAQNGLVCISLGGTSLEGQQVIRSDPVFRCHRVKLNVAFLHSPVNQMCSCTKIYEQAFCKAALRNKSLMKIKINDMLLCNGPKARHALTWEQQTMEAEPCFPYLHGLFDSHNHIIQPFCVGICFSNISPIFDTPTRFIQIDGRPTLDPLGYLC